MHSIKLFARTSGLGFTNEHEWLTGAKHCDHEELTEPPKDPDGTELQYFQKNEPAFSALHKVLTDDRWMDEIIKVLHKILVSIVIQYVFR